QGIYKVLGGRVDVPAGQLIFVGKSNAVHDEVEISPNVLDFLKYRVQGRRVGDIAVAQNFRAEFLCQWPNPFFKRFALVGEGEFGARLTGGLGDSPRYRPVVGDPQNQAAFSRQNTRGAASKS